MVSCHKEQGKKGIKDDSQVSNLGSDSDTFLARRSGFRFLFLFSFSFLGVGEKVHEFGFSLVELEMSLKHVSRIVRSVTSGMRYIFRVNYVSE